MKNLQRVLLLASIICVVLISCKKNHENPCLLSGNGLIFSGSNEVPATTTKASGKADIVYNKCDKTLHFKIQWENLSGVPVAAHIHGPAAKGVNASIVFTFSDMIPKKISGSFEYSIKIDEYKINESELKKGNYYINIHSANFPAGEIRAQIEFK